MEFNFKQVEVGTDVTGTVIDVKDNEIRLDLGYVLEGTIYLNEFTNDKKVRSFHDLLSVGDEVVATVKKIDEVHGHVLLSRLDILKEQDFKIIVGLFEQKLPIEAKVIKTVHKGIILDYLKHEIFMHESQVEIEPVEDLSEYVGQTLKVIIQDIDKRTGKLRISRKQLLLDEMYAKRVADRKLKDEQREAEWATFKVGSIHKGTVKEFHPFGAIIAFEHNQGVLPLKEIAHYHIQKAEDELRVGEEVEVKVLEATAKNKRNRLSLSRRALLKTPYEIFSDSHKRGEVVTGTVVNKLPFGILVELDKDVTGLLHNNEISWNPNDNFKSSVVFGDTIELHILSIDAKNRKISLSKKLLEDNPWAKVTVKYGDVVIGKISEILVGKGFFVSIQGVDAFLPSEEIQEGPVGKLEDIFAIGEEVEVKVTKAYLDEWKIEVSIKQLKSERERAEFDKYIQTQETRSVTIGDQFGDLLQKKLTAAPAPKKITMEKKAAIADPSSMTVKELRDLAKEKGLEGYSSLKKSELLELIK